MATVGRGNEVKTNSDYRHVLSHAIGQRFKFASLYFYNTLGHQIGDEAALTIGRILH